MRAAGSSLPGLGRLVRRETRRHHPWFQGKRSGDCCPCPDITLPHEVTFSPEATGGPGGRTQIAAMMMRRMVLNVGR